MKYFVIILCIFKKFVRSLLYPSLVKFRFNSKNLDVNCVLINRYSLNLDMPCVGDM